ncbi:MAG: thymidine phosphorylase [Rubripirellula sp.]
MLTDDEIRFLVHGFCTGEVADYQMSALAMAICLQGMIPSEIATLTHAMLESGERLPRPTSSDRPRVDKHSTGGLGDKVSLVLAPLLAACDVDVPMISGRGLGLTGGTLDKLESIKGFQVDLSSEQSTRVLRAAGTFIISATEQITPADRKLYALRDVTGTVESIPLITASILSKKLAANVDALVMDVKTGGGAFMRTEQQALELATSLVQVGTEAGLPTSAILTDMDQPLGETVGNAIEVNESVQVLSGATGVVRELTLELAAEVLVQANVAETLNAAKARLINKLDSGAAMERFEKMVHAQGGRLDTPLELSQAHEVISDRDGSITSFDCNAIGNVVVALGGGRRKKDDVIDHGVGIRVHGRIGDRIEKGQPILTLHCHKDLAKDYLSDLQQAVTLEETTAAPRPLILRRIGPTKRRIENA